MDQFERLLAEQRLAIEQTNEKINKLCKFSEEYTLLKQKLTDLSHCFTKKAIVPFSPKALVFAKFIHTNEVLVHLGGCAEHFCEVSTQQALLILDYRIYRVEKDIKGLREQLKLLNDRETFTSKLSQGSSSHTTNPISADDQEKEIEIREEYDVESEEKWLRRHKEYVSTERKKREKISEARKLHKVTFADEIHTIKNITSSDSEVDEDSIIHFHHSNSLPRPVRTDLDWSMSSPADVVERIYDSTLANPLTSSSNSTADSSNNRSTIAAPRKSPFLEITERDLPKTNETQPQDQQLNSERPVSRFKALRLK